MSDPRYAFGALAHDEADRRMRERLDLAEQRRVARRLRRRRPSTRARIRHLAGRAMVRVGPRLLRPVHAIHDGPLHHDEGATA